MILVPPSEPEARGDFLDHVGRLIRGENFDFSIFSKYATANTTENRTENRTENTTGNSVATSVENDVENGENIREKIKEHKGENKSENSVQKNKPYPLVAFPTETVYGLGANALSEKSLTHLFEVKGRPFSDPAIVHVCDSEEAESKVVDLGGENTFLKKLFFFLTHQFWPGPLSLILKAKQTIPKKCTAFTPFVAVRCPNNALAVELIRRCGVPLAAPSANKFKHISPTEAQHVEEEFRDADRPVYVIHAVSPCEIGLESTVVSFICLEKGEKSAEKRQKKNPKQIPIKSKQNPPQNADHLPNPDHLQNADQLQNIPLKIAPQKDLLKCEHWQIKILRRGGISKEQIQHSLQCETLFQNVQVVIDPKLHFDNTGDTIEGDGEKNKNAQNLPKILQNTQTFPIDSQISNQSVACPGTLLTHYAPSVATFLLAIRAREKKGENQEKNGQNGEQNGEKTAENGEQIGEKKGGKTGGSGEKTDENGEKRGKTKTGCEKFSGEKNGEQINFPPIPSNDLLLQTREDLKDYILIGIDPDSEDIYKEAKECLSLQEESVENIRRQLFGSLRKAEKICLLSKAKGIIISAQQSLTRDEIGLALFDRFYRSSSGKKAVLWI